MTEKQICDYYKYYRAYSHDAISVLAAVNKTTEAAIKDLLIRNGIIKESEEEPMAKVSPEMQEKIYQLWKEEGLSQKAIAERFGISGSMVSYVINRMKPKTNAEPEAKTETEKEPAQAAAGQAITGNYNTTNIAQSEGIVKNFTDFLPILLEFAQQLFGDIKVLQIHAADYSDNEKSAQVTFVDDDGNKYYIRLEGGLA